MRIVQFENSGGRRLGVVVDESVRDVTAVRPELVRVSDAFDAAQDAGVSLETFLEPLVTSNAASELPYAELLEGDALRPPLDHADPHRVLLTGTGLTHLGSMESRDQMHAAAAEEQSEEDEAQKSDSKKMFEMGLRSGKPAAGSRGVGPEWFFKGCGWNLRGHNDTLEIPPFALDGGEEPEIVGCYIIDKAGVPRRLGLALANEWSDHVTENINYLYLAPSKLRQCAIGPELITGRDFRHIELRCTVKRADKVIYDSGTLLSGEENMSHSMKNCEDHHFKYPQHRVPGDVHIHFFGTSKLSYSERDWKYSDGDEVRLEAPGFSAALVNSVRSLREEDGGKPIRVELA